MSEAGPVSTGGPVSAGGPSRPGGRDAGAPEVAITVVGHDRPGIIAQTAQALAGCGMNLEDSSMTLLRGHFAMTLVCAGDASVAEVEAALAPLTGGSLTVAVREMPTEAEGARVTDSCLVTVHGADRLGIVAQITGVIAAAGANITDLTTRLVGELYLLVAEVDLPPGVTVAALEQRVREEADELGVEAHVRPLERDDL